MTASETRPDTLQRLVAFAAVVEIATGLVLIADPAIVVRLLLGVEVSGVAIPLGRCFGIALLGLGFACWPGWQLAGSRAPAFWGMLLYNAGIALYLALLGTTAHSRGVLLWPAVALHAVVALWLVRAWRANGPTRWIPSGSA